MSATELIKQFKAFSQERAQGQSCRRNDDSWIPESSTRNADADRPFVDLVLRSMSRIGDK